ncbi:MAG TPA: hypothetical protein DCE44_15255 [Verrucomicrobiales bacterium]|nr:hypothetical protein [Verrucomicrobiales bacterium]
MVAPIVTGTGGLEVGGWNGNGGRGDGRARIDALDRSGLSLAINPGAAGSVGGVMMVFPSPAPRLDIVAAAGRAIAVDSGPVSLTLPFGTSPNQTIQVRARDFGQVVPIRVVLTPDNGSAATFDAQIDNTSANPAEVTVPVVFPLNILTHVQVWTR